MIIAIDYNAAVRQIAGIGRYAREIVQAFAAQQTGAEIVLFYAARDLDPRSWGLRELHHLRQQYPAIRTVALPFSERMLTILWQRLRVPLPVERWTGPLDLLHAPDFVLPPTRARSVVTVHDLTFRVHPETAHPRLRHYLNTAVPRSLARADAIVAVSHSTSRDLQRLMHIPASKISVIEHGLSARFRPITDPAELGRVRARYEVRSPFLLHVGTIEPRKNLVRLMDAFAALPPSRMAIDLVLAGKTGWLAEPIIAQARRTTGVRLIGPVEDADLPALYSLSDGVVYPSLYEGFGFPALEALACGKPVIAANTSSLPEILGDAALLVHPLDTEALTLAMHRVLNEPALTDHAEQAGPLQAARFTWERAAQQLQAVYQRLGT